LQLRPQRKQYASTDHHYQSLKGKKEGRELDRGEGAEWNERTKVVKDGRNVRGGRMAYDE
jgi:hypothetical protein